MLVQALTILVLLAGVGCNRVEEEEQCVPGRCLNGGKCVQSAELVVYCECRFGFRGEFCEQRAFPLYNLFQHDPEYMYDHPRNVWSNRFETEAIKPILASSTQTIADVIERFYNNIQQAYDRYRQAEKGQQPQLGFEP